MIFEVLSYIMHTCISTYCREISFCSNLSYNLLSYINPQISKDHVTSVICFLSLVQTQLSCVMNYRSNTYIII